MLVLVADRAGLPDPGGVGGGSTSDNVVATWVERPLPRRMCSARSSVDARPSNCRRDIGDVYSDYREPARGAEGRWRYKAHEMGLKVSDQELGDAIQSTFAAQMGGKFDIQRVRAVSRAAGDERSGIRGATKGRMLGARLEVRSAGAGDFG